MSHTNSILKNKRSKSGNKRVSWGGKRVLEFESNKAAHSQDPWHSDSSEEDEPVPMNLFNPPALSPSARPLGLILEEVEASGNSNLLTPVNENAQILFNNSESEKFDSQVSMNYLFPELEVFEFKSIKWDFVNIRASVFKQTPIKAYQYEAFLNDAKTRLVRSKADLEILNLQKENFYKERALYQEQIKNTHNSIRQAIMAEDTLRESGRKKVNSAIAELNDFNEHYMMDISLEKRWELIQRKDIRVFVHKKSIVDYPILKNLYVEFDKRSLKIELTQPLPNEHIKNIWTRFKHYLQRTATGTEFAILSVISTRWCYFAKFIESLNKLMMISDIKQIEMNDSSSTIIGSFLDLQWESTLSFANIELTWDIFSNVNNFINSKFE